MPLSLGRPFCSSSLCEGRSFQHVVLQYSILVLQRICRRTRLGILPALAERDTHLAKTTLLAHVGPNAIR